MKSNAVYPLAAELTEIHFAQFSDCHLNANANELYNGVNSQHGLQVIVERIKQDQAHLDFAVFTGDLSQDHSEQSYQLFEQMIATHLPDLPVFWIPGNHDNNAIMTRYLTPGLRSEKVIDNRYFSLLLLDTTSETPAGYVPESRLRELEAWANATRDKVSFIIGHHHIQGMQSFIDQHILESSESLVKIMQRERVSGYLHGHIHAFRDQYIDHVRYVGCPSTAIQFNHSSSVFAVQSRRAGMLYHSVKHDGSHTIEEVYIDYD